MTRKLLDANVIIRYLVDDDKVKAGRFKALILSDDCEFILSDVVLAEVVWVLESYYRIAKLDIVEKLQALLALPTINANTTLLAKALELFGRHNVDYVDAYVVALAQYEEIKEIVSYDRDLDKLHDVKRVEP